MKNPQQAAQKWAQNLAAAGPSITAGVQAVQKAPTQSALDNIDSYVAGVNNAVSSGRMASALQSSTLQGWQQAMLQKGLPRIAQGAQAAIPKTTAALQQIMSYQQTLQSSLPPKSKANSQARMNAWFAGMSQFKLSK